MVCPGLFQPVSEVFNGLISPGVPNEKADGGGGYAGNEIQGFLHDDQVLWTAAFPVVRGSDAKDSESVW
jgi:hypothetical protein